MKRLISILMMAASVAFGQQTPQQLANNSAAYNQLSYQQLQAANTYLLALITGVSTLTPSQIVSSSAAYGGFADRDLMNAQTYLLSQIQSGPITPYFTNFVKVGTTNSLISSVNGATAGTTIYITPGVYNIGTNILVIPDNVNLIGPGHDQVNIIGFADCAAHELGAGAPTGGPQIHPGNNCIVMGFTVTCDTNNLVIQTAALKHSGSWAAIGVSYLNPPATTSFTNDLWKDIWVFEGYFDCFHLNPSNRCEVRLEDCRGEAQGGIYNFVSNLPERTNTYRMERCVGISHGVVPTAVVNAGFVTGDFFVTFDQQVQVIDCSAFCVSNVVGGIGSAVFNAWSTSTSNLLVIDGGYYFTTSTTDTTWNATSVAGNFTAGTLNQYPTNIFKPPTYNFPLTVAGSGSSYFSNTVVILANGTKITGVETNVNCITYNTNAFVSGNAMDVTLPVQFINAGANVTIAGFLNVEYNHWYQPVLMVSNNLGSAITMTFPNGTAILTNAVTTAISIPGGKRAKFMFDIYPHSTSGFTNVTAFVQSN